MGEQVESIRRMLESIPKARVTRRGFVVTALTTGFALAVRPISAQTVTTDAEELPFAFRKAVCPGRNW